MKFIPTIFVCVLIFACVSCEKRGATATTKPVAPRRIITIAPNSAEIIAALGAADRLVAVSTFTDFPPELGKLPRIGGPADPDVEAILRLAPDLLVLRGHCLEVESLCRDNGIAVYMDPTETLDDIFTNITQLGDLLDKKIEARAMTESLRGQLDRVRVALEGRPRPRVLYTIARSPDSLKRVSTTGKGTFLDKIITLAGGQNVFGNVDMAYPDVSMESIVAAQPEVIIEAMPEVKLTNELRGRILDDWRRLGGMPATRDGRVYILTDEDLIPSPRIVDSIRRIAKLLHPEVHLD